MQAIILAAGQGQRIREHHTKPKGFIEINQVPLIQHSLTTLRAAGITDITLVTGYRHECYDELAQQTGWFKTLYNPEYATFGNLYSLYVAKNIVKDDVLLVESDIIYEPRAIQTLLNLEVDSVLTSGPTHSGDEVYVMAEEGVLTGLSKQRDQLDQTKIVGEFVGLTRLNQSTCQALFELCDQDAELCQQGYYEEDGLVTLSSMHPLHCHLVEDLRWSEIDTLEQLHHAEKLFPQSPVALGVSS